VRADEHFFGGTVGNKMCDSPELGEGLAHILPLGGAAGLLFSLATKKLVISHWSLVIFFLPARDPAAKA